MTKLLSLIIVLLLTAPIAAPQRKISGTGKLGGTQAGGAAPSFTPLALRFDGNTANNLQRTTGLLAYNSSYTCMGWVRPSVDTNTNATVFIIANQAALVDLDVIQADADGTSLKVASCEDNTCNNSTTFSMTVGTWYHWAMVRSSATSLTFWVDGNQIGSAVTTNVGSRLAATDMNIGRTHCCNNFVGEPFNGRIAAVKCWTSAFSEAQIEAEMVSYSAVASSPWGVWKLLADGSDSSGNARNFTVNGTLNVEAGPSISP